MIERVHHHSIIVADLEKSVKFYQDMLGLKLLYILESRGEEVSKGVGVKEAHLKIAVLHVGEDTIELIQYVTPKGEPYNRMPCDIGNMHIAFRVSDVHSMYNELKEKGIKFNNPPITIKEGPMKGWIWVYFSDPDGAQLEFVEQH